MMPEIQTIDDDARCGTDRPFWRRYWPLAGLAALLVLAFVFDLHKLVSFEALQVHGTSLQDAVDERPTLAALGYVAGYAVAVALAVPGAVVLTIAGGLLFGTWLGGLLAISGATTGAVLVFLAARTSIGRSLTGRAGPWLARLQAGFRANAWSYLFVLRVLPLVPFVVVNVGAALLGVRLKTYVLATAIGILPGSFIYAGVGNGLGTVLASGAAPDLQLALEPTILGPLVALALLALLPVGYRWARQRGRQE